MRRTWTVLSVVALLLVAVPAAAQITFSTSTPTFTRVRLGDGTATAPSLAFASDTDTGFLSGGANTIGVSLGGTTRYYFGATFQQIAPTLVGSGAASAFTITQTWNTTGAPTALKLTITDTASDAASLAMQILGGASGTTNLFKVDKGGSVVLGGSLTVNANAVMASTGAGILRLTDTGGTYFTRMSFGPISTSASAIATRAANGLEILSGTGSSTWNDASTAASGTLAIRSLFGMFTQPTLTATNASVTYSDAATWYIANAPTAGTNVTITRPWAMWIDDGNFRVDGVYYTGTTAGCSGTPTVATNGIATTCTSPDAAPDNLLAMIQSLQTRIAALEASPRIH